MRDAILSQKPTAELIAILPLINKLLTFRLGANTRLLNFSRRDNIFGEFHKQALAVAQIIPALEKPLFEILFEAQYRSQETSLKDITALNERLRKGIVPRKIELRSGRTRHPFDDVITIARDALQAENTLAPAQFAELDLDCLTWMDRAGEADKNYVQSLQNKIKQISNDQSNSNLSPMIKAKAKALTAFFKLRDAFVAVPRSYSYCKSLFLMLVLCKT